MKDQVIKKFLSDFHACQISWLSAEACASCTVFAQAVSVRRSTKFILRKRGVAWIRRTTCQSTAEVKTCGTHPRNSGPYSRTVWDSAKPARSAGLEVRDEH